MQCTSIWSPILKQNINAFESIQRLFTKYICGLRDFSSDNRFTKLGALTLENRYTVADMIMVFKIMRRIVNCSAAKKGLTFRCTNNRKGHIQLKQPIFQRAFESYF